MRRSMSGEEYQDWIRYYNTEPFGAPRREAMHGDLMSSLWAFNAGKNTPKHLLTAAHWQYSADAKTDQDEPDEESMRALFGMDE